MLGTLMSLGEKEKCMVIYGLRERRFNLSLSKDNCGLYGGEFDKNRQYRREMLVNQLYSTYDSACSKGRADEYVILLFAELDNVIAICGIFSRQKSQMLIGQGACKGKSCQIESAFL